MINSVKGGKIVKEIILVSVADLGLTELIIIIYYLKVSCVCMFWKVFRPGQRIPDVERQAIHRGISDAASAVHQHVVGQKIFKLVP